MEDALGVEVSHSLGDVGGKSNPLGPLEFDGLVAQHRLQTPTVDKLKSHKNKRDRSEDKYLPGDHGPPLTKL